MNYWKTILAVGMVVFSTFPVVGQQANQTWNTPAGIATVENGKFKWQGARATGTAPAISQVKIQGGWQVKWNTAKPYDCAKYMDNGSYSYGC